MKQHICNILFESVVYPDISSKDLLSYLESIKDDLRRCKTPESFIAVFDFFARERLSGILSLTFYDKDHRYGYATDGYAVIKLPKSLIEGLIDDFDFWWDTFKEGFVDIAMHELVHVKQRKLSPQPKKKKLSTPYHIRKEELQAFAHQLIDWMKRKGYSKDDILKIVKNDFNNIKKPEIIRGYPNYDDRKRPLATIYSYLNK